MFSVIYGGPVNLEGTTAAVVRLHAYGGTYVRYGASDACSFQHNSSNIVYIWTKYQYMTTYVCTYNVHNDTYDTYITTSVAVQTTNDERDDVRGDNFLVFGLNEACCDDDDVIMYIYTFVCIIHWRIWLRSLMYYYTKYFNCSFHVCAVFFSVWTTQQRFVFVFCTTYIIRRSIHQLCI